jgi:hypothetical protein
MNKFFFSQKNLFNYFICKFGGKIKWEEGFFFLLEEIKEGKIEKKANNK